MIVLDTHIWVWWVHDETKLTKAQTEVISENESDIIGVSAISCWEVAKLVELERLTLPCPVEEWFEQAFNYPGVCLLELTPDIAIEFDTAAWHFSPRPGRPNHCGNGEIVRLSDSDFGRKNYQISARKINFIILEEIGQLKNGTAPRRPVTILNSPLSIFSYPLKQPQHRPPRPFEQRPREETERHCRQGGSRCDQVEPGFAGYLRLALAHVHDGHDHAPGI